MQQADAIHLVQLSDMHLFGNTHSELLGVNTLDSFQAVLELVKREMGRTDLIILSGDISQDGSKTSYETLVRCLRPFNIPTVCFPGNHDDVDTMAALFPNDFISMNRHLILGNWQLVFLNSQKVGEVPGYLDAAQLNFLEHCLQQRPHHHTIVMFHHHPIPVGAAWLDNLNLKNADEFWQVLSHYSNVKAVFFGHVHQEFQGHFNGVLCAAPPSTCVQFKRHQNEFGLENLPPGFRVATLYPDGRIETKVIRAPYYIGTFDENAKGY